MSNFTFLKGGSSPEEYAQFASLIGLDCIAIADENSVAGLVRAHTELEEIYRQVWDRKNFEKKYGTIGPTKEHSKKKSSAKIYNIARLIPATRLILRNQITITAIPKNKNGWSQLTKLLSIGNLRAPKGQCHLELSDIIQNIKNTYLLLQPPHLDKEYGDNSNWIREVKQLICHFSEDTSLILSPKYNGMDLDYFSKIDKLSKKLEIPLSASASPIMHKSERRQLMDILTAIRIKKKVQHLGRDALTNAEQKMRNTELLSPN